MGLDRTRPAGRALVVRRGAWAQEARGPGRSQVRLSVRLVVEVHFGSRLMPLSDTDIVRLFDHLAQGSVAFFVVRAFAPTAVDPLGETFAAAPVTYAGLGGRGRAERVWLCEIARGRLAGKSHRGEVKRGPLARLSVETPGLSSARLHRALASAKPTETPRASSDLAHPSKAAPHV
jgi:hypothetical protein